MDERKRQRRQEEFARLDAWPQWLQWLQKEHPFLARLLTIGIALVLFGLAMGLRWLVESGASR